MKLTKQRLKEIIENETRDVINEGSYPAVEEYIKLRDDPSVELEERIAHAKKNERYLINFIKYLFWYLFLNELILNINVKSTNFYNSMK